MLQEVHSSPGGCQSARRRNRSEGGQHAVAVRGGQPKFSEDSLRTPTFRLCIQSAYKMSRRHQCKCILIDSDGNLFDWSKGVTSDRYNKAIAVRYKNGSVKKKLNKKRSALDGLRGSRVLTWYHLQHLQVRCPDGSKGSR